MVGRWLAVAGAAVLLVFTCAGGPRSARSYLVKAAEAAAGSSVDSSGILAGRVAETRGDHVLIALPGGPAVSLRIDEGTRVLAQGELVSARELMPGTDVRATYRLVDGKPVADWIEATTAVQH